MKVIPYDMVSTYAYTKGVYFLECAFKNMGFGIKKFSVFMWNLVCLLLNQLNFLNNFIKKLFDY